MRDAAYDSILNSERKRLHRSALDYLEGAERNAISNITEDLAFHAERGQAAGVLNDSANCIWR